MTLFRAMCWGLALSGLLWVPSSSLAQGDASKPCGCTEQDLLDVKSRIQQTQRAMDELDRMIKEWSTGERATMTMADAGSSTGKGLEGFRDEVLMSDLGFGMVRLPGARSFGATTDPNCEVTFPKPPTQCLKGALLDHEAVHVKACKDNKQSFWEWVFADWKGKQRVADYLREERAGYQKENERLKKEQEKQPKTPCTELDKSAKAAAQQSSSQSERNNDSANRLSGYGVSLK